MVRLLLIDSQMPLRRSSREFQFINTSDPDERTFLVKSMDKIN